MIKVLHKLGMPMGELGQWKVTKLVAGHESRVKGMNMGRIENFEDIEAWQKARELTREIYRITNDGAFARDFGLRDQIRRAAVSIMSNIAEDFGRGGNKEFIQFLSTAIGSSSEVQAQLYIALDADYITKEQFRQLYDLAQSAGKLIGGFIRYLRKSDHKGVKFS